MLGCDELASVACIAAHDADGVGVGEFFDDVVVDFPAADVVGEDFVFVDVAETS